MARRLGKWLPLINESYVPPDDSGEDYPMQYIMRCKGDGGRGYFDVYHVKASEMWNIARDYDYSEYLVDEQDWFQELSETQKRDGYSTGKMNMVALLGMMGEAGEVFEEYLKQFTVKQVRNIKFLSKIDKATKMALKIDALKKQIRDGELDPTSPFPKYELMNEGKQFDSELGDVVYYLNALAVIRGKTLMDYAQMSVIKVQSRVGKDISHANQEEA